MGIDFSASLYYVPFWIPYVNCFDFFTDAKKSKKKQKKNGKRRFEKKRGKKRGQGSSFETLAPGVIPSAKPLQSSFSLQDPSIMRG